MAQRALRLLPHLRFLPLKQMALRAHELKRHEQLPDARTTPFILTYARRV
jgi:hypothetical protein